MSQILGRITLAFRGTQEKIDWGANIIQGVVGPNLAPQYREALVMAEKVNQAVGGNLIFTGHSLGGGLASASANEVGGTAVTFNPSGLGVRADLMGSGNITTYLIYGEILNSLQNNSFAPSSIGTRYYLEPSLQDRNADPITLHLMPPILRALQIGGAS